jgi:hypothetical protein
MLVFSVAVGTKCSAARCATVYWASSIAMEMARTTSVPGDEDKITILAITELIKPECLSQWPILGHFDREPSIADFGT